jgi:putative membrane protein
MDIDQRAPVGPVRLWFGALGGPAAWFVHLVLTYALVPVVCRTVAPELLLHGATVLFGAVAAGAAVVAWRNLTRVRGSSESVPTHRNALTRVRFMAQAGLALDILFLLVIIAEGSPALIHDPCLATEGPLVLVGLGALSAGMFALALGGPAPAWAHSTGTAAPALGWNFSPELVLPLLALLWLYVRGARCLGRRSRRLGGLGRARVGAFSAAFAALVAALVSPIDRLGGVLFSAHMVQHMLLMLVAAPLLVLGAPRAVLLWGLPRGARVLLGSLWRSTFRPIGRVLLRPEVAWVLHALAVWLWHVPRLYEAALENDAIHLLEHASFLGTALLFWGVCVRAGGRRGMGLGMAILYIFTTAVQGGALGALVTFAPRAWYAVHQEGPAFFGLTPLEDQQLAGLLMWVPGGVVYLAAALVAFVAWLRRAEALARLRDGEPATRTAHASASRRWT